jgi:hypothetical protein
MMLDSLFSDDDSSDDELKAKIKKISTKYFNNSDPRIKEIGDRIKIWDFSSVTDCETNSLKTELHFTNIPYLIVIETNLSKVFKFSISDFTHLYVRDLTVVDPKTNIKYWVSSDSVKIVDKP